MGGTIEYFKLDGADAFDGRGGGLTFDVGATIRPTQVVSLAVVGTNLRDLGTSEATQAIGYGVALIPTANLLLALDGLTRLTADNETGRQGTSVMGGGSYTFLGKLVVRAGGGYDASTGNSYATFGLSGSPKSARLTEACDRTSPAARSSRVVPRRARRWWASACASSSRPRRRRIRRWTCRSPRAREQSVTRGNLSTRPLSVLTWKRRSVSRGRGREGGSPIR